MSDIISRPYTPEGEETWERVFVKNKRLREIFNKCSKSPELPEIVFNGHYDPLIINKVPDSFFENK